MSIEVLSGNYLQGFSKALGSSDKIRPKNHL